MQIQIPPKYRKFVQGRVKQGVSRSVQQVVETALIRLKEDDQKLARLKRMIQEGIDELDRGEYEEWDVEATKRRLRARLVKARSR
jgi:putative addiction module CopG family antidote